jgi:C4-dicarboxylate-specific signal transduction histidine kinase
MKNSPNSDDSIKPSSSVDISGFVAGMSHEIANIFNTITINVEMVKYLIEGGQTTRAGDVLQRLVGECERCNRLVQGMQRFGSGLRSQDPVEISVREQIQATIALAHDEMRDERPTVSVSQNDDSLRIRADAPALNRAMAGLLHNALEAGAKAIQIDIRRNGDEVIIDFRDDGSGIAEAIRPRVTEAFFSTRRGDGCCGLGLTLMQDLALRHGGSLSVAANEPQGALLSVRLPVVA